MHNFLEEFIKIIGSNLHIFYLYINYIFMILNYSPNRYIFFNSFNSFKINKSFTINN